MKKKNLEKIITNDDEIIKKGLSNKQTFLVISGIIITIIFFLSTSLELDEEKAKNYTVASLAIFIILLLLFYYNFI